MGSPTKEKFREGVQQEILTNYYMSRYDRVMSRMNEKKVQTIFAERLPSEGLVKNPKRKNFKELILQKKANQREQPGRQLSGKRNFKHEIQHKNSLSKLQKENKRNFYRLEDTIISQLYKPSPSELEKRKFTEIEVLHKISYDEKREKVEPFRLVSNQEEDSIEINYQTEVTEQSYEVETSKIQHDRLSEAIRSSFEKRKSPPRRTPSKSKNKQEKKPPKSPENRIKVHPPQQKSQQPSNSREDSFFFENVRPSFENMERNFPKNQSSDHDKSFQKKINFMQSDRQSNASKVSRQKSVERHINKKYSRRSSLSPSLNEQKKKNGNVDDSFHRSIPEIQHQPKISPRQKEKERKQDKKQERSEGRQSDKNPSMKSSRIHNESEMKDTLNDFSMVSRFSMISEEGMAIQEQLQRQLNENEFGPYQNALTSLLSLISQYPNAWPIYVVGQRILEDRHLYQNKRMMQQNQLSRLQGGVQSIKRARQKQSQIDRNSIEILKLVRQLSQTLSPPS